jgi:Gas vesicle protein
MEQGLWHERQSASPNLADILERVLDKGLIIAGDIKINLLDIELLTIKLRLLVASVDKAKAMGIDWWEYDPALSHSRSRQLKAENAPLRKQVRALETATLEARR